MSIAQLFSTRNRRIIQLFLIRKYIQIKQGKKSEIFLKYPIIEVNFVMKVSYTVLEDIAHKLMSAYTRAGQKIISSLPNSISSRSICLHASNIRSFM